ncbi:hypothetical protein ACFQPF_12305 [Fictibacillus iocasae]|uniref:Carbonic anhydrase n=1 Tax=Fictibacillus iocasae TaxID=2715437 RepID=A0ABW2NT99_9BACL
MAKTLIVTGGGEEWSSLFSDITKKKKEDLVILRSCGSVILQPYGCLMRNIILAIYTENADEIVMIGERDRTENNVSKEMLWDKIQQTGVTKRVIHTINYTDVVNHDVLQWLAGPHDSYEIMRNNIERIKKHPLIPKSIDVHGYMVNRSGEFEKWR